MKIKRLRWSDLVFVGRFGEFYAALAVVLGLGIWIGARYF